jgi:uncharacterized membrane protein YfcA
VANSGGTIIGPYLAGLGLSNAAVVATGAGRYLGSWLGWRVNAYIPRRWFALALIAISVAGSLKLLLTRGVYTSSRSSPMVTGPAN